MIFRHHALKLGGTVLAPAIALIPARGLHWSVDAGLNLAYFVGLLALCTGFRPRVVVAARGFRVAGKNMSGNRYRPGGCPQRCRCLGMLDCPTRISAIPP